MGGKEITLTWTHARALILTILTLIEETLYKGSLTSKETCKTMLSRSKILGFLKRLMAAIPFIGVILKALYTSRTVSIECLKVVRITPIQLDSKITLTRKTQGFRTQ